MIGLRYGSHPQVTDVISRKSEYLRNNHEIIYLLYSKPIHLPKQFECMVIYFTIHFINNYLVPKFVKSDTFSNFLLIILNIDTLCILIMVFLICIK